MTPVASSAVLLEAARLLLLTVFCYHCVCEVFVLGPCYVMRILVSFSIFMLRTREVVALLQFYSCCCVAVCVLYLFLAVY